MPTVLYTYDPLDRLIQTAGIRRFYNSSRMTTEIEGAVQRSVFQVGDHVLAEGGAGGSNLLATDLQRSVLHTVNPDKTQPMAYNVYGHRPAESGVASVLGFNGERADPVTGHYLLGNGYRAFNPVLMRFNSPDSWSPFGNGGINCYGYCGGDSINRRDDSGHAVFFLSGKGAASSAGFFSWLLSKRSSKSSTKYAARFGAAVNKETVEFFRISELEPGIFAAYDRRATGELRLTLHGHGNVGYIVNDAGQGLTASYLARLVKKKGYNEHTTSRIWSCYSGAGDAGSLAQAYADITQQSVKGMEVKLAATFGPKQIMEAFHSKEIILNIRDRVRVEKKYTALKSAEQFESNESAFPGYRSRVFTPSVR
ncbi:hypothetical protein GHO25_16365 [Pseudomonas sp. FSL R10-1350]|uniref:RHS repeat-associated core domain-containing protein n=1 Tax=Pseudomonas sp. FSL R10-1350 TaxID=2662197 RepID=UPI00129555DB|nr:RHS repeat-associated core domain-containing protein [Pseudomonas sp. FSL R10-1350]MQU64693.1 hypothetical protein [Pseudomonas sp. FSL R10-1350]